MGYSLVVDYNEPAPLASVSGWADFKKWALALPSSEFEGIAHLAAHGYGKPLPELRDELSAVLKKGSPYTPKEEGVKQIATDLLATLKSALLADPESKLAFVSDGMT